MKFISEKDQLLAYERKKWDEGFSFVAGVDEVGRGPLAGPVVAAAVVLPRGAEIPEVDDSKKLSEGQRDELYDALLKLPGIQYSVCEMSPEDIDEFNILRASQLAMMRAVDKLDKVDFVLIDGLPVKDFHLPNEAVVKGDSKSASIAAASIIAKVYRDRLMTDLAQEYPDYGFEKHKGYGTALHLEALKRYGVTPLHRKTFAPVRDIIDPPPEQMELF